MSKVKINDLFIVGYGLGGSFGGINNYEVIQASGQDDADSQAYELACEEYNSYDGMYGLMSVDKIMEEEEVEEEEAILIWEEERESWLVYSAKPYSKEYEKEIQGNHYDNSYVEITGECED